jgi:hypothetical protein
MAPEFAFVERKKTMIASLKRVKNAGIGNPEDAFDGRKRRGECPEGRPAVVRVGEGAAGVILIRHRHAAKLNSWAS